VEIHLNEWNCNARIPERGRSIASACTTAMMCAMQYEKMDMMCYYDARLGVSYYAGLFNTMTFQPTCVFYAMKAFGKIYAIGTQVALSGTDSKLYAVAAKGENARGVLIANIGEDTQVETDLPGTMVAYLVDENNYLVQADLDPKCFHLKENQVVYLEETV
jgi:Na+-transporting NADH:ubiquinone oxidoreductase subunit NqrB